MITFDLSESAIRKVARVDLRTVTEEPGSPIGTFEFHGCLCGVASFHGTPPWELHNDGDELLHILDGWSELTVIRQGQREAARLGAGTVAVVPQGCWHSNHAPEGVTMLYFTPLQGNDHSWEEPLSR